MGDNQKPSKDYILRVRRASRRRREFDLEASGDSNPEQI
jgi:hypothetical protein